MTGSLVQRLMRSFDRIMLPAIDAPHTHYTTAVRDRDEAMLRHVEDSLALLPSIEGHAEDAAKDGPLRLIDVGSGGGLPGLLLAIARPEW